MFEGTSIQFVVDAAEVRDELNAGGLNWPIIKILGGEEDEEKDPEDMSVSNTGVAIYIDSIDLILKERVEKAKEIVTAVARMIQYFNERNEGHAEVRRAGKVAEHRCRRSLSLEAVTREERDERQVPARTEESRAVRGVHPEML